MPAEDRAEVLRKLKAGLIDVIVQVQMLGEGFDHPQLSVAAIFRPFRSLAPIPPVSWGVQCESSSRMTRAILTTMATS